MSRNAPLVLFAVFFLLLISSASAQDSTASSNAVVLRDGTPVALRMTKMLSSADALPGDKLSLEVLQDVLLQDRPVIVKGGLVSATVVTSDPHKGRGHDGKLIIHLDYVTLADGETVEVRTSQNAKDPMTQALLTASNFVDLHESTVKQSMHGKDVAFVQGMQIAAFINGDAPIDIARFQPLTKSNGEAEQLTRLEVSSSPNEAEVNVDGRFISDTPAIIGLTAGIHIVTVRRAGYQFWQETMQASGGTVKRNVRLIQDGSNGTTLSNCWGSTDCSDTVGDVAGAARATREMHAEPSQNSSSGK